MNIGIVVQNAFPDDREVRAGKMARTLNRKGHSVFMISPKGQKPKAQDKIDYAVIRRLGYFSNLHKVNLLLGTPLPMNLLWTTWILHVGRKEQLDVLIIGSLRLMLPCILAARLLRIPVIWDMMENYSALALSRDRKPHQYIIKSKLPIFWLERLSAKLSDFIWVVVEENKDRLIKLKIDAGKIEVISNMPELETLNLNKISMPSKKKFTMIYVGLIEGRFRGIDLILQSLKYMLHEDPNIEFLIVGDGKDKMRLERLAETLNVKDAVKFTGWIKSEDLPEFIKNADVGLIPHEVNALTQTTIPNKLFDYMIAGLPVISTDIKPIKKIIEPEQCGIIIPNNPEKAAHIMLELKESSELRIKMSKNGRKAVIEKYNWDVEAKTMFQTINHLVNPLK